MTRGKLAFDIFLLLASRKHDRLIIARLTINAFTIINLLQTKRLNETSERVRSSKFPTYTSKLKFAYTFSTYTGGKS